MKKMLVIVVIVMGLIVYAKFQNSGESPRRYQSTSATTPVSPGTAPSSPMSDTSPPAEKKYTIDQIKLTPADGVTVNIDCEKDEFNSPQGKNMQDQMRSQLGVTPSSFFEQNLTVNGELCSMGYIEFANSTEAASARQGAVKAHPELNADSLVRGNFLITIGTSKSNIVNLIVNILLKKTS